MTRRRILFVTGKLAAPALSEEVRRLSEEVGFEGIVHVAKISVAALMTPDWLIGKLPEIPGLDQVMLPGWCLGDLGPLSSSLGAPVERGPKNLLDLREYFQRPAIPRSTEGRRDIQILAEINNADRLEINRVLEIAERYQRDGADMIDLGCSPDRTWSEVGVATRELVSRGHRVSIDSFNPTEVDLAIKAGATLVLSVHHGNRERARDWGREVVVIPDASDRAPWFDQLLATAEYLGKFDIPYRLDPILEPIGVGFASSIGRYLETRRRRPGVPMMMGIGNLTEMTEVDSAGVNALLIGLCQEMGIQSVLTTEVANWARTSVREVAIAAELMSAAVEGKTLPKGLDERLLLLRDRRLREQGAQELQRLQSQLRDPNFRIFAEEGAVTIMNHELFERGADPFLLFEKLKVSDPAHAFYLGWEMMKATLALHLGKRYEQDQALRFGYLTKEEVGHRARKDAT